MRDMWLKAAGAAGAAVRGFRGSWPGIVGAALVCSGLALIYDPLGLLAAGGFLLVLDSRRP